MTKSEDMAGKTDTHQRDEAGWADQIEIESIVRRERRARDMHFWDELAACYHPDSAIDISWFRGTGAEFAQASRKMAERMSSFHELDPLVVDMHGDRAITDMGVTIHLLGMIGDVEVDCVSRCRSLGRVERKQGRWLMAGHGVIYLHDWLVPLIPGQVPAIDGDRLGSYRRPYRFLSYVLEEWGMPARDDLPALDRPETVERAIARERAWLENG